MEEINQILLQNAGNRLTPELINGIAHAIRTQVEKLLTEARDEVAKEKQQ